MAPPSDRDEIIAAWRALGATGNEAEGWKTIPLSGSTNLRAGRHFPDNEEAILIGFSNITIPPAEYLPQGKGFLVTKVDVHEPNKLQWLALARRADGSLDLFTTMILDIMDTIQPTNDQRSFQRFLTRIRAWQDFMRRGADTTLSPNAEVGLVGELMLILEVISAGLHPGIAIESWDGPNGGVHDFVLGTGAIEVKTTIATTGFPAMIESLDQLDDAARQPLFLGAVRLRISNDGATLTDVVERVSATLADDPARATLSTKLLQAGYLEAARDHYQRRFTATGTHLLRVSEHFPRLTKTTVPYGITAAHYEIDIDQARATGVPTRDALTALGVL